MPSINNQPALKINRQPRGQEETAKPSFEQGASDFLNSLAAGAQSLIQTVSPMAGMLGGGLGTGTLGPLAGLGGMGGLTGGDGFAQQLALIQLQRQIQMQTQVVETMSNISKAEHDARMASVRNMRP